MSFNFEKKYFVYSWIKVFFYSCVFYFDKNIMLLFFYNLTLLIPLQFLNSFFSKINSDHFQIQLFVLFLLFIIILVLYHLFLTYFIPLNIKLSWYLDLIDDILLHIWGMLCTVNIRMLFFSRDSFLRRKVARNFGIFVASKRREIREYRYKNKPIIRDFFFSNFFFFLLLILVSIALCLFIRFI